MKKRVLMVLMLFMVLPLIFAGGGQEKEEGGGVKILRVADSVISRFTPGNLEGTCLTAVSALYDYLVILDPDTNELTPQLATSWETEDGKVWTLHLKEGVTFHDGTAFTADDVIYTIERTQDPDVGHQAKWNFYNVESMESLDDYTLAITLGSVTPSFMYYFTEFQMAVVSSEYDNKGKGDAAPMGTGPFIIKEYVPKESILFVKNENYWKPGLPKLDELHIYMIGDTDRRVAMLEGEQVDLVKGGVSPLIMSNLLKDPRFDAVPPYYTHRIFNMDMTEAPFDDNRVRLAMKYCLDLETLASICFAELSKDDVWITESPVGANLPIYNDIPLRTQNIDKAKSLLAEAGYPDGFETELYYATDLPSADEIAQSIKEMAALAGIEIELKGSSRDVYLSEYWKVPGLGMTAWNARVEPSSMLNWGYRSDGSWNESSLNLPEMDEVIDALQVEIDPEKRQALYNDLQQLFYEQGTVVVFSLPFNLVKSKKLVNYRETADMISIVEEADILE